MFGGGGNDILDGGDGIDTAVQLAIVTYKDATNGEASQVALSFTDQDDFTERETAINAIADSIVDNTPYGSNPNEKRIVGIPEEIVTPNNSPTVSNESTTNTISVGGGGDTQETPFGGLLLALSDAIGAWRYGEGTTNQIVLFSDGAAKDDSLAEEITTLAHSIGGTVDNGVFLDLADGTSVESFNLQVSTNHTSSSAPTNNQIDINNTTAEVQIFVVFLGTPNTSTDTDTTAYEQLVNENLTVPLAVLGAMTGHYRLRTVGK